jgi:trehalose synthase
MSSIVVRAQCGPPLVLTLYALVGCGSDGLDNGASAAAEIHNLETQSMLFQGDQQVKNVSGSGNQWQHQFGDPQPVEAVNLASVWLLHYPGAVIPEPDKSVIGSWASPQFWDVLRDIGIDLLHTNPVQRAGGLVNGQFTPTIDGWFDRISLEIDPQLGTEQEFRQLVQVAGDRGGSIASDLVPLHTGLGADFRLATRAYKGYPGVYTIVEILQEDWSLLPNVGDEWSTALVSKETGVQLVNEGYIPGIIDPADADPAVKSSSGWSATGEIRGTDGKSRRWVYLHVFKPAQPALNWSDPSYGGRRVAIGDAVRNIYDLGNRVVRLDAIPFLGIDPRPGDATAENYMHPLSIVGANDVAFTVRKFGGFSFQELNVPIDQAKEFSRNGPDLTYDFFTRAESIHPLISADVTPLRIEHRELMQRDLKHRTLIHDLQNHDEITYQLVNLGSLGEVQIGGERLTGQQLKDRMLEEMRSRVARDAAPYNKLYRVQQDGVATTFVGFIAPALGINPYSATPEQVSMIRRAHILVAMANAMQPGVFGLSGWDLVGALPIPEELVADRMKDGDFRWVNRGAVDLLGANPNADKSIIGLPRATALYGSLPEQLRSPDSFASQLRKMLAARKRFRIPESEMLAVPDVSDRAVCVLVMGLPGSGVAVTALNYARESKSVTVNLSNIPERPLTHGQARDIIADQDVGSLSNGELTIGLDALSGRTIEVR